MKILLITDTFPPESVGGAGQVVLEAAKGFARMGHKVTVLTTTRNEDIEETAVEGYRVIRVKFKYRTKFLRSYIAVYNPFLQRKITRIVTKERPDIVHCHNLHEFLSFSTLKWARSTGAPVFLTAHDVMSFSYTRLDYLINKETVRFATDFNYRVPLSLLIRQAGKSFNPVRNLLIRRLINQNTKKVFAVSSALRNALMQNGIKNVQTVYNGILPADFTHNSSDVALIKSRYNLSGKKIIFFGGRAMMDKGTLVLIDAFREIINRDSNICLVMATEDNQHTRYIRSISADIIQSSQLILSGILLGKELVAMFYSADVVVIPSIYFDPAPLMIMQAMACHKPVVGTCFGGTPEIIKEGETGLVVNPYRKQDLANALLSVLENPARAQEMGEAGFQRLQKLFTLERHMSETIKEYQDAVL